MAILTRNLYGYFYDMALDCIQPIGSQICVNTKHFKKALTLSTFNNKVFSITKPFQTLIKNL